MNFERVRLVTRRARLNMTQEALAQAAGVSVRSIAAWESGTQQPTLRMLNRLADALSVPVGWLVGESAESIVPNPLGEPPKQFRTRADRIIARMAELSDSEFGRIEPVFLGIIDALLAGRANVGHINSDGRDPMEDLAEEIANAEVAAVVAQRTMNVPGQATTFAKTERAESGGAQPSKDVSPSSPKL